MPFPSKGNDMTYRTCTVDGCERKHVGRGLCKMHWKRQYEKRDRFTVTCQGCGEECQVTRPNGKYCSLLCRDYDKWGPRLSPWSPPSRAIEVWRKPRPTPSPIPHPRLWVAGDCRWCGSAFSAQVASGVALYCSNYCGKKAGKARRRAREAGAQGAYTWAEVTRLWISIGKTCAYCHRPKRNDEIEPDHVIPISRGGSNSITNVVPACHPCNGDKRDLDLDEWYLDRERRGLEPRRLSPLLAPVGISPAA